MSEEKVPTREEKLAPLIAKAWTDEAYRKELLANPKGVLQKEFTVELPKTLAVEVLEESATRLYIVIPAKPSGELTDDQLESVAGGFVASGNISIMPYIPGIIIRPSIPGDFPGSPGGRRAW